MIPPAILNKAQKLHNEIESIKNRRIQWDTATKSAIAMCLTAIKDSPNDLRWFVQQGEGLVNIQTNKRPIKVSNMTGILTGGFLTYMQAFNGKVIVVVGFPYDTGDSELISRVDDINLGTFEPHEINKDLIFQHVDIFLDKQLEWENSNAKNNIGFQI